MARTGILEVTDGTTTISFLGPPGPFFLDRWKPQIAQPKGGGTWQQSSLSDGRRLVDKRYNNVIESFTLKVKGFDADVLAQEVQELRRLLEKGSQYFSTDWQTTPVYLSARGISETNTRHATIHSWSTPEDEDPFGLVFEKAEDGTVMASWTLLIERSHWTENVPGTGTCVQASGQQDSVWPYYIEFNGTTSSINCGSDAALDDLHDAAFTVEAWIRADSYGELNIGVIATKTGSVFEGWKFWFTLANGLRGDVFCATAHGQAWSGLDDITADSTWHHVAMTWDDAAYNYPRLWVDGTEVSYASTNNRNGAIVTDAGHDLIIGQSSSGQQTFDGGIGWVRISDNIRWAAGFTPQPRCQLPDIDGNTVAIWIYEGQGATADNYEGTAALDGTITDGDWGTDCATAFGRDATCDDEVYIANKSNRAQLTHIFTEDAVGVFTGNLLATTPNYQVWPVAVAADDAIYFGIDTTVRDSGPFCSLVFDIGTLATYTGGAHAHWQYWSSVGPGWVDLGVVDNTAATANEPFTVADVGSVHWAHSTNWITNAINGITAYWIRCVVHIPAGVVTHAHIQNRQPYTITWPYIEIAAAQVGGDMAALARQVLTNWSYLFGIDTFTGRVIAGLRSTSRGTSFQSYLNCAPDDPNDQNPDGVDVTYGASTTSVADVSAITGYRATCTFAAASMVTRVRLDLDSTIASQFLGRYHAYVRCAQIGGAAGDITVRVGTSIGAAVLPRTGPTTATYIINDWMLLDVGQITFPSALDSLLGESFNASFHIQAARSTGAAPLYFYDLILIPADEWIGDFAEAQSEGLAASITLDDELEITSLLFPRIPSRAIVWDNATGLFRMYWQSITASPSILQANVAQRLHYVVTAATSSPLHTCQPWLAHSVQLSCNQRYFSYRGAR